MDIERDTEQLRQVLLDDVWAGAASGLRAMCLDEEKIRQAGPEELEQLARQYDIK